jgi:hypothetical protein
MASGKHLLSLFSEPSFFESPIGQSRNRQPFWQQEDMELLVLELELELELRLELELEQLV